MTDATDHPLDPQFPPHPRINFRLRRASLQGIAELTINFDDENGMTRLPRWFGLFQFGYCFPSFQALCYSARLLKIQNRYKVPESRLKNLPSDP
jgi:hypothetical protein